MKAFQNFFVRTKVYLAAKDQSRQVEFFQKKMQNQHSGQTSNNGGVALTQQKSIFLFSRTRQQLTVLRSFQKLLNTPYLTNAARYIYMYRISLWDKEGNQAFNMTESEDEQEDLKKSSNKLIQQEEFEGILGALDSPGQGKWFCGKYIEVNFQHTVETLFNYFDDNKSMATSEMVNDEDYMSDERIQRGACNPLDLTCIRSEMVDFSY